MKPLPLLPSFVIAALFAVIFLAAARAGEPTTTSIAFSDPARPGTVRVQLSRTAVRIQGGDTNEVTVTADVPPATGKPRRDGLRVLTTASSFSLTEKDNVVTLDAIGDSWAKGSGDLQIVVPRSTSVIVQNSHGGDVSCSRLSGDLDITAMNGEVVLDEVSGGVVVQTMNGGIRAGIAEMSPGKPLAFTSLNGEVQLRLPPAGRANLRIRTQNGSVLTDFPETALVTKTEAIGKGGGSTGILPAEARQAIREAGRVAVEAAREVEKAVREAAQAAREGAESARPTRDSGSSDASKPPAPPKPVIAPRPPRAPVIPTITGGKLLTGTLNGGGSDVSVTTMNGDVVIRQLDSR